MSTVIIPATPLPGPLFKCGHPKTPDNSYVWNSNQYGSCRFCRRVASQRAKVDHQIDRWRNGIQGTIARRYGPRSRLAHALIYD